MQTELLNTRKWPTTFELTSAMADWIDNLYNAERLVEKSSGALAPLRTTGHPSGGSGQQILLKLRLALRQVHIFVGRNSLDTRCPGSRVTVLAQYVDQPVQKIDNHKMTSVEVRRL
ncbi:hypothetical protein AB0B25_25925 [Nocardia sp. NPDC049190]|uniref:hypothetical protein n=1 Tax=Nocardia sp. NPDC049190 TaxID=3155650 RepID=UPI0033D6E366